MSEISPAGHVWDATYDVVVVGGGMGGLIATVRALLSGARTLTLEKGERLGGTTSKSMAGLWVLNNHHMRPAHLDDPEADALRYMARLSRPASYDPDHPTLGLPAWEHEAITAFYRNGSEALHALHEADILVTVPAFDAPDYFSHLPENAAPHGRLVFPQRGAQTIDGGRFMVEDLAAAALSLGGEIRTGHRVLDVLLDDEGAVAGVEAETDEGRHVTIAATGGVIFASGGFARNPDLRVEYLSSPYQPGCAALTNTGDFVHIARRLGAHLVNMSHPWSAPIVIERSIDEAATFAATFHIPGDGCIAVNRYGRRAVNEKAPYNEFTRAFFASDATQADFPNIPIILLWDDRQAKRYGVDMLGIPFPADGVDPYWVIQAPTLDELAIGIDARLEKLAAVVGRARLSHDFRANLRATLARFAQLARTGIDDDFSRGATEYEQYMCGLFGPGEGPNPTMRPLDDTGPYYATILSPGAFETKGGPRTDTSARVIHNDGEVIPGLYAVGNCAGSPSVEAYWSGGASLGWALCFGYQAGIDAAARANRLDVASAQRSAS